MKHPQSTKLPPIGPGNGTVTITSSKVTTGTDDDNHLPGVIVETPQSTSATWLGTDVTLTTSGSLQPVQITTYISDRLLRLLNQP